MLEKMKKLDEEQFDQVFDYDNQMHGLLVEMTGMTRLYKAWKELELWKYCYGLQPEHG